MKPPPCTHYTIEDWRELAAEKAAIYEYDANMSREDAEQRARDEVNEMRANVKAYKAALRPKEQSTLC